MNDIFTSSPKLFGRLTLLAAGLTFFIVTLGAFVRLSDAGLGCPDWPGCYGHLGVPDEHHEITSANAAYPERPVEAHKAWKEMIHRYFASTLGLLLVSLAVLAWRLRKSNPGQQLLLPLLMVPLVMLQGAFGMWTVTLKVHPVFVTGHLLFGMTTLSLIWLMWLKQSFPQSACKNSALGNHSFLPKLAICSLLVLVLQIILGGWVSTNYAALQCPDFPACQGQLLPDMNIGAFNIFLPIGPDYEGGRLDNIGRMTIHVTHRFGALAVFFIIGLFCMSSLKQKTPLLQRTAIITLILLLTQVCLGISNVVFNLPLPVAVAHNAVAALLLLSVITMNFFVFQPGCNNGR